jgi:hypothetical protein
MLSGRLSEYDPLENGRAHVWDRRVSAGGRQHLWSPTGREPATEPVRLTM